MKQNSLSEFGTIRSFLWPIYGHEMRKFVPMLLMLFFISFNYTILRNMKDAVVVTNAGAEVIPFIKVWTLLPIAILLTVVFNKLSDFFSQENAFYMMVSGFLIYFALFAFLLYPYRDSFQPLQSANYLESILPRGLKGMVSMYRHWTLTSFYVFSELWGTFILSVSFWGFANEVTKLGEARRFYSVFSISANFAGIAAGQTSNLFLGNGIFNPNLPYGNDAWEQTMMGLFFVVFIGGFITIGLFWWLNRNIFDQPKYESLHTGEKETKKHKKKLTLRESFAYLSKSKYLLCIAVMVVSYNLVINLVEVVWKDQLRVLHPSPSEYNHYINNLSIIMGIISTLSAVFMAKIINWFGWTKTALVNPIFVLITSVGFFGFLVLNNLGFTAVQIADVSPVAIAVFFGSAQNIISKATKYTFFDTTKEMAFIPLEHDIKLKGKAAIDGVGSRFGKSGGSLIHQSLLIVFSSLSASAPYVGLIILSVCSMWIVATKSLGRRFAEYNKDKEPIAATLN
ncbi:MAG: AAA family ATPase [Chlamydia sp. 32-24]|mgnify:FL=1|nr:MAG: AAA family ATPase [Chlamydia sp. 32-24]